ncbi:nitrate/nitrite transporter [Paludifilum halophilum]|uniref:Nitrate/nitrite transporter n=1 Tax=Paludifilum halophilum TaxID=1642702 RepID=A0A235B2Y8_9BACL|nr:nitrate/nitrite transporter [Paludifilum halophilum]OYD06676.1 nitrate/nitrite transporter [Paludifilum halophilum]
MDLKKVQLPLQTFSLVAGFIVWVILSSLLPFIKEDLSLSAVQASWVTAVPVVLGSILRIPLGYLTNRYGARMVFTVSFLLLMGPLFYISIADSFADLIVGGFFLGIAGAIFSIGVTSLPKYYPKNRHGFVNGVYGLGNIGTAITSFSAPIAAAQFGWPATVRMAIVIMGLFVALNLMLGDRQEPKVKTSLTQQVRQVYRNASLWALSLFYFITFGAFVAFTVFLPHFLVSNFGLDKVDAGLRTAGFIVLATGLRPLGGWMGDRWNPFVVLMFVFGGLTLSGVLLSFSPTIGLYTIGSLMVAVFAGIGNGTVFKLVPLYFSKQAGIANGVVSAMGGLGGFFPPLILATLFEMTGHYAIGFMALSEISLASLMIVLWMFYQGRLKLATDIVEYTAEGILITDANGLIQSINPAFTKLTGYRKEEVVGKKTSILKSGKHESSFYKDMWADIEQYGYWQGEIWNKRKTGELYPQWLTISAIKNEAGEVKGYAGMFSDISKQKTK